MTDLGNQLESVLFGRVDRRRPPFFGGVGVSSEGFAGSAEGPPGPGRLEVSGGAGDSMGADAAAGTGAGSEGGEGGAGGAAGAAGAEGGLGAAGGGEGVGGETPRGSLAGRFGIGTNSPGRQVCGMRRIDGSFRNRSA